jgi:hypothetical protein
MDINGKCTELVQTVFPILPHGMEFFECHKLRNPLLLISVNRFFSHTFWRGNLHIVLQWVFGDIEMYVTLLSQV